MRSSLVLLAAALGLLAGCAAPQPVASNPYCEDFARSGGYPILSGGGVYGPNQDIEQLPGEPPLIFGPFDSDIQRHLLEEQYLRDWCLKNLV